MIVVIVIVIGLVQPWWTGQSHLAVIDIISALEHSVR